MKTLRIVSADMVTSEGLNTMLIRNKQFRVLPILRDGREILERYMEERTDVLLVDLELPGIDGLEIVEALCSLPLLRRPQLFVMAGEGSASVLESLGEQIAYCFLKPLDPRKTAAQLYALTRGEAPAGRPDHRYVEYLVTRTLFSLGVPPHLQGYHLLREAIKLVNCADHPSRLSIMRDIYPAAARLCGTSVSMAEHAMRHAIECAWMRADINTIQTFFGYTVEAHRDTPSNSAFIHMVADRVRMRLDSPWAEGTSPGEEAQRA